MVKNNRRSRQGGESGRQLVTNHRKAESNRDMSHILLIATDVAFAERFSQLARRRGFTVTYAWSLEALDSLPLFHLGLALVAEKLWKGDFADLRPRIRLVLEQIPKVVLIPDLSLANEFEYEQYFLGVVDEENLGSADGGSQSNLVIKQGLQSKDLSV